MVATRYGTLCDELKSETRKVNAAWWRIGEILHEIKHSKLYLEENMTWEAFCERYVGFKKRHADSLIKNADTRLILDEIYRETGRTLPILSESAVAAVSDLSSKGAVAVLEKVRKNGPVTARKIKVARVRVIDPGPSSSVPAGSDTSAPAVAGNPVTPVVVPGADSSTDVSPPASISVDPAEPADFLTAMTDDHCLELSALVSNRVGELTGRVVTESEDCALALEIGSWLRGLGLVG